MPNVDPQESRHHHVGIRRCATVVEDPNGKFLHLIALAEPDDSSGDQMEKYRDALLAVRAELSELGYAESTTNRLAPTHHTMPLRGG